MFSSTLTAIWLSFLGRHTDVCQVGISRSVEYHDNAFFALDCEIRTGVNLGHKRSVCSLDWFRNKV